MEHEKKLADISIDLSDSTDEAIVKLAVDVKYGLSTAEAEVRLRKWGYNEVSEEKTNAFLRFAGKFWGLSAWMLELVILLSWYLQKFSDMVIVAALLFVNAILGFWEERQAERSLDELKNKLHVRAKVLRDGSWNSIPAKQLVPGDIIRVRSGDFVPADIKIIEGEVNLDQSALTGESAEVQKTADGNLYGGSIIKRGEASGIVLKTGVATFFGRTTQLVQIARHKLHIEELIEKVVTRLLVMISFLVAVTLGFTIYRHLPLLETLPLILVVLLSAIPVALPVMLTVTTALGSRELAKEGVLVTKLSASEDAAMMNVICIDKTGTITLNKLTLTTVEPFSPFDEAAVLKYAALASQIADQDPIDSAIISAARERKINIDSGETLAFLPFTPETRRTEATIVEGGETYRAMKGAVSIVSRLCQLDGMQSEFVEKVAYKLSAQGNKVIAVARTDTEGRYALAGLVGLNDVPRPDSKKLLAEARALGINIKMLTGDALTTARAIAAQVGIGERIVSIKEIRDILRDSPEKAAQLVESYDGFAEVYPEDKYLIVKSLQMNEHVVGMTGDGVNDAPALKQADVGIAVSNATDVAKGAASVVLIGEGLSGIISLIKIGRKVHRRIAIWVLNKISRTILKSVFVVGTYLVTGKFLISAFAMLLLVFLTDFVKIALATDNVRWSVHPSRLEIASLARVGAALGLIMFAEAVGLLYLGIICFDLTPPETATFSFEILFFLAIFSLFVVREEGHFWNSKPSSALGVAILVDALMVITLSLYGLPGLARITPVQMISIVLYCLVFGLVINDFLKLLISKLKM